MKTLNDYMDNKTSEIYDKYGAYFAFSSEQFNAKKAEGTTYTDVGFGLLCPTQNSEKIVPALIAVQTDAIKQRLTDYGIEKIIRYELSNYECYYTGSTEQAKEVLYQYGATDSQISDIFKLERVLNSLHESLENLGFTYDQETEIYSRSEITVHYDRTAKTYNIGNTYSFTDWREYWDKLQEVLDI